MAVIVRGETITVVPETTYRMVTVALSKWHRFHILVDPTTAQMDFFRPTVVIEATLRRRRRQATDSTATNLFRRPARGDGFAGACKQKRAGPESRDTSGGRKRFVFMRSRCRGDS